MTFAAAGFSREAFSPAAFLFDTLPLPPERKYDTPASGVPRLQLRKEQTVAAKKRLAQSNKAALSRDFHLQVRTAVKAEIHEAARVVALSKRQEEDLMLILMFAQTQ